MIPLFGRKDPPEDFFRKLVGAFPELAPDAGEPEEVLTKEYWEMFWEDAVAPCPKDLAAFLEQPPATSEVKS